MNFLQLVGQMFGQLPASNSPKFSMNTLDWAKITREVAMLAAALLIENGSKLLGVRYEFNGQDYTMYAVIGIRLALQWAKQFTGGQKA